MKIRQIVAGLGVAGACFGAAVPVVSTVVAQASSPAVAVAMSHNSHPDMSYS